MFYFIRKYYKKSAICLLILIFFFQSIVYSAAKLDADRTVEVKNVAPIATTGITFKKKFDLNFNLGQTASVADAATLQYKIDTIVKPQLIASNIDFNINVVANNVKFKSFLAGNYTTFAIAEDNSVWGWGSNDFGKLGLPDFAANVIKPIKVSFLSDKKITQIVGGPDTYLALDSNGDVWSWGMSNFGQGGIGTPLWDTTHWPITKINTLAGKHVTNIAASGYASVAVTSDGKVWGWGSGGTPYGNGEVLGWHGTFNVPTVLTSLNGKVIKSASIFYNMAVYLTTSGEVIEYSPNWQGGSLITNSNIKKVVIGNGFTGLILFNDGTVYSWGTTNNSFYTFINRSYQWWQTYVGVGQIPTLSNIIDIVSTGNAFMALRSDGTAQGWGYRTELGLPYTSYSQSYPVGQQAVFSGINISTFAGSGIYSLDQNGEPYTFGGNDFGQRGLGYTSSPIVYPTLVPKVVDTKIQKNLDTITATQRSNSDSIFIDISDVPVDELTSAATKSKLLTTLTANDISFVGLGVASNQSDLQTVYQQATGYGAFINNTNIDNALQQLVNYVLSRKYVDIKYSYGITSSFSMAALQSSVEAQIKSTLASQNIVPTFTYAYSNTISSPNKSPLYPSMSNMNYNVKSNRYLIHVSDMGIEDLSSSTKAALYNNLILNNIHYVGLGTSINQADMQTVASQNANNGVFYYNNAANVITNVSNYIISTALSNVNIRTTYIPMWKDPITGLYKTDNVTYTNTYGDYEGDPFYQQRYKYSHDPIIYENHLGMISDSDLYRATTYSSFDHSGKYTVYYSAKDNPKNDARFDNYKMWSDETLGPMILFVHHAPEAQYAAVTRKNNSTGYYDITINDTSYDLDHLSAGDKGIIARNWKYKNITDSSWTIGTLPSTLPANQTYYVSLQVQDYEGQWSLSTIKTISTFGVNDPPVAKFTWNPGIINAFGNSTINDQSYDPNGDPLTHIWTIVKDGVTLFTGQYASGGNADASPDATALKNWATSKGVGIKGEYVSTLVVHDASLASQSYTDTLSIRNTPPIATMTYPNGSQNTPTLVSTPRPTFQWTQSDQDGTVSFTYFQIQVTNEANDTMIFDSGQFWQGSASNLGSWTVNADLPAGQKLQVRVKVYDGMDWSNWSTTTWFYINRPPTGNLNFVTPIYQNDTPTFTITQSDPDNDPLTISVDCSFNGGAYVNIAKWSNVAPGISKTINYGPLSQGVYSFRLTLDDGKGGAFIQNYTFTALPLTITATLKHTIDWENNRQQWNLQFPLKTHALNDFWAGEAFELTSLVTDTGTSITKPQSVSATLLQTGDVITLSSGDNVNFSGEMLNTSFIHLLQNGPYTMRFQIHWTNGLIQSADVPFNIKGNIFDVLVVQNRN